MNDISRKWEKLFHTCVTLIAYISCNNQWNFMIFGTQVKKTIVFRSANGYCQILVTFWATWRQNFDNFFLGHTVLYICIYCKPGMPSSCLKSHSTCKTVAYTDDFVCLFHIHMLLATRTPPPPPPQFDPHGWWHHYTGQYTGLSGFSLFNLPPWLKVILISWSYIVNMSHHIH